MQVLYFVLCNCSPFIYCPKGWEISLSFPIISSLVCPTFVLFLPLSVNCLSNFFLGRILYIRLIFILKIMQPYKLQMGHVLCHIVELVAQNNGYQQDCYVSQLDEHCPALFFCRQFSTELKIHLNPTNSLPQGHFEKFSKLPSDCIQTFVVLEFRIFNFLN